MRKAFLWERSFSLGTELTWRVHSAMLSQSILETPGFTLEVQIHFLHEQYPFIHLVLRKISSPFGVLWPFQSLQ